MKKVKSQVKKNARLLTSATIKYKLLKLTHGTRKLSYVRLRVWYSLQEISTSKFSSIEVSH